MYATAMQIGRMLCLIVSTWRAKERHLPGRGNQWRRVALGGPDNISVGAPVWPVTNRIVLFRILGPTTVPNSVTDMASYGML